MCLSSQGHIVSLYCWAFQKGSDLNPNHGLLTLDLWLVLLALPMVVVRKTKRPCRSVQLFLWNRFWSIHCQKFAAFGVPLRFLSPHDPIRSPPPPLFPKIKGAWHVVFCVLDDRLLPPAFNYSCRSPVSPQLWRLEHTHTDKELCKCMCHVLLAMMFGVLCCGMATGSFSFENSTQRLLLQIKAEAFTSFGVRTNFQEWTSMFLIPCFKAFFLTFICLSHIQ